MTASMYQDGRGYMSSVGQEMKTHLPQETAARTRNATGRFGALKQGSIGPTLSELEIMQQSERKQHQQNYNYEHGHNDGSAPGWRSSF